MFRPRHLHLHIDIFGPIAHKKSKSAFRRGIVFSYAWKVIVSGAREIGRAEHLPAWLTGLTGALGRTLILCGRHHQGAAPLKACCGVFKY